MKTALEPNRDQLEIFIEGMLRHCGSDGIVSSRAFFEGDDGGGSDGDGPAPAPDPADGRPGAGGAS